MHLQEAAVPHLHQGDRLQMLRAVVITRSKEAAVIRNKEVLAMPGNQEVIHRLRPGVIAAAVTMVAEATVVAEDFMEEAVVVAAVMQAEVVAADTDKNIHT